MPRQFRPRPRSYGNYCPKCDNFMQPGVAHKCPTNGNGNGGIDWKWLVGFALQFIILMGTMLWKGGALQSSVENMQKQLDHQQQLLDRFTGGGR